MNVASRAAAAAAVVKAQITTARIHSSGYLAALQQATMKSQAHAKTMLHVITCYAITPATPFVPVGTPVFKHPPGPAAVPPHHHWDAQQPGSSGSSGVQVTQYCKGVPEQPLQQQQQCQQHRQILAGLHIVGLLSEAALSTFELGHQLLEMYS